MEAICTSCNLKITEEEGMFTCTKCKKICCFINCFILSKSSTKDKQNTKIKEKNKKLSFICLRCNEMLIKEENFKYLEEILH